MQARQFFFFFEKCGHAYHHAWPTDGHGRPDWSLDMVRSRLGKKKKGKVSWAACLSRKALAIHFVMGMG
jgi:hypothetical protein